MPAYRVEPDDSDGDGLIDMGGGWKVVALGTGTSTNHGTKHAAVSAARNRAREGQKISIYDKRGKFQKTETVGGSGGGIGGGAGGGLGANDLPDELF